MVQRMELWRAASCLALTGAIACAAPQVDTETTTVFLVRHAEQGEGDNPSLTENGRARAAALAHVLEDVELDAVYSTPLNRTLETARPVAEQHGLNIITSDPTSTYVDDMANALRVQHVGQTVLVVSHSNTVPAIVNALGGGPFDQLAHEEYDALFLVTLRGDETDVIRMQYGATTP